MNTLCFLLCLRILWPMPLLKMNDEWSPEAPPRWAYFGQVALGLIQAQPDTVAHFIHICYQGRTLSAALGVNWHLGKMTCGHLTGLRQLLLMSGDVESNPGPTTKNIIQFICNICGRVFTRKDSLQKHHRSAHTNDLLECNKCCFTTKHPFSLKRHLDGHRDEAGPSKRMKLPNQEESDKKVVKTVLDDVIGQVVKGISQEDTNSIPKKTALNGRLKVFTIDGKGNDVEMFLSEKAKTVDNLIQAELQEKTGVKAQLVLSVDFYKPNEPTTRTSGYFWSENLATYRGTVYNVASLFPLLYQKVEKFQKDGSGWAVERVNRLELYLAKLKPLRGATYVRLPKALANKKAIINVQNDDDKCFLWSILASIFPAPNNPHRLSNYEKHENSNEVNMQGIEYPVALRSIEKFERQNKWAIDVYGYEDENLFPVRISKCSRRPRIQLFYYENHYCLIKDLNRLLFDQREHKCRKFFCPRCLIPRTSEALLEEHMKLCDAKDPTKVTMPEEEDEDEVCKFKNINRQLRQPLVVYADFECLLEKETEDSGRQLHVPCGYGLVASRNCCGVSKFDKPEVYRGENVLDRFFTDVQGIAVEHQTEMANQKEMGPVDGEKQKSSTCHICGDGVKDKKVKDHCHLCGKYRGPAHRECNSGYRLNRDIVVVFHNLRKYDGHLLMQKAGKYAKLFGYKIEVIAKAMEDYISFSMVHKKENDGPEKDHGYKIKFIDSVQFLNNSLAGLVNNLERDQFHALSQNFSQDDISLLTRKGVYPYEYMDCWQKFAEKSLPAKEEFYSSLTDNDITEEDYQHAKSVWTHFKHQTMGDYHDLYLKTDVLLLADVFEAFREFALEKYGLDPCHYTTTPSLGWDACLKMTKVELELMDDPDKYLFCEAGIRGGISMISHRYAKANNPLVPDYDPTEPKSYIVYLDANNLYGWAMLQKLPVEGFSWMGGDELDRDWKNADTDGDEGYILEVDLEYPKELHDSHDMYPLAPETMEIRDASPYCNKLKDLMDLKLPPQTKLVPNLFNKKNYILHYRNLKLYLQLGMKLKKVHRGLKFKQRAWMSEYIMFNTRMRALAVSDFEKNLLKLFNNAVFGKTMENVRKYKNIELVEDERRFEKLVANSRYRSCCRFNEDLVGVALLRASTCLNKPIYCGLSVLDLSKELMYQFHYEYIVPKYGANAKLLFTDTDSLCYLINTDDIYTDMHSESYRFDFSDYPKDHKLYSTALKKKPGVMKDETNGVPVQQFVGLRPKMYALWPEKKRAKGIKRSVVQKDISFQDYVDTLFRETSMEHEMTLIRSHRHELFTETMKKKSLCAYDDKRWLLDKINSRSRGHYLNY